MSMICEIFAITPQAARQLAAHPSGIHGVLESLDEAGTGVSLEKSWHGLHFALTGDAADGTPPLDFLVSGGSPVGDEDVGYGPARLLEPSQVATLNVALDGISAEDFARRFDPGALEEADVYPNIWDDPLEELLEEYQGYFAEAKKCVAEAARDGNALLVVLR